MDCSAEDDTTEEDALKSVLEVDTSTEPDDEPRGDEEGVSAEEELIVEDAPAMEELPIPMDDIAEDELVPDDEIDGEELIELEIDVEELMELEIDADALAVEEFEDAGIKIEETADVTDDRLAELLVRLADALVIELIAEAELVELQACVTPVQSPYNGWQPVPHESPVLQ
jgi:hypothetical protein